MGINKIQMLNMILGSFVRLETAITMHLGYSVPHSGDFVGHQQGRSIGANNRGLKFELF